jgi:hypothetical protein
VNGGIDHVSNQSGSLLGAVVLAPFCAFVCKAQYFIARVRKTVVYE